MRVPRNTLIRDAEIVLQQYADLAAKAKIAGVLITIQSTGETIVVTPAQVTAVLAAVGR
jgi:hypothetical protein